MLRLFWLSFGLAMVGLAFIGLILPLVPTTPFLLLAAYGFARSSKRLHDWLLAHRHFGPLIRNWRANGSIDRRTKIVSIAAMIGVLVLGWLFGLETRLLLIQLLVMSGAGLFILTRPAPPSS